MNVQNAVASVPPRILDPMPEPPLRPEIDECCGSGCDPCIFDLYDRAMERYERALLDWRARHPGTTSSSK